MKLMIAGLSSSGKSSLARLLSQTYGLQVVSGSTERAKFFALDQPVRGRREFWAIDPVAIASDERRLAPEGATSEAEFDRYLAELYEHSDDTIFDVWFLPWLVPKRDDYRLWMESPLSVRAHRAFDAGADWPVEVHAPIDLEHLLDGKDERCAEYGRLQYGISLRTDRSPFDAILHNTDNSSLASVVERATQLIQTHSPIYRLGE